MANLTVPQALAQALALAVEHHEAGRLGQAEAIYRQVLAQNPNQPDALHLLGVIATRGHQHGMAEQLIRRAISFNPRNGAYHNSLGVVLKNRDQLEAAIAEFRDALQINPADG